MPGTTAWGTYKIITEALRGRLASGEFPPGASLPSESVLCAQYNVARNTMRRALAALAADGLIAAQPGRGRIVVTADDPPTTAQYRRIVDDLRARIVRGDLAPGDMLPSESALMDHYGVARGTARHALAELEGAGLVEAVHGKGRFVRRQ